MIFYTLKIKDNEYKCKISARGLCNLEDRLGVNPLNVFMSVSENNLPKLSQLLIIFHESLAQYNHGISEEEVDKIYDDFIDEGHSFVDFLNVILEILKVSGLVPKEEPTKKGKTSGKN